MHRSVPIYMIQSSVESIALIDRIVSELIVSLERLLRREISNEAQRFVEVGQGPLSLVPSRVWAPPGIQHQAKGLARGVKHVLQSLRVAFVVFGQF